MTTMSDPLRRQGPAAAPMTESASTAEALPNLLRHSLRCVLAAERNEEPDEAGLRVALRDVCERARCDGIRAEHLLVVLKASWRELPERAALPRYHADQALGRVISACIKEYYQDPEIWESDSPLRCIQEADRIQALLPRTEIHDGR